MMRPAWKADISAARTLGRIKSKVVVFAYTPQAACL